ncbi:hypothetical protein C2G38_2245650 [Gigaspora rosea]|uniref:Tyr recombinase domain-containing protein n=1 Tax=Gigaspora rosea TaxID=44941 RepID=A0A397V8B4_9GLOM|nr:hypothetical protein C2G38_2245650 [Gigaspora rosea]
MRKLLLTERLYVSVIYVTDIKNITIRLSKKCEQEIDKGIWYKTTRMGTNKLREMFCQITEKTGVKIDERKITNHSARKSAIKILKAADVPEATLIPYAAVDNDLEEFYSYPGNLYTHESESEDNDDDVTNDDKHVNKLDVKQKSKLYAPFKSPLLKNPPNKESQKPLYEHQPTNQIINPNQEQNCLQVQSQAQNYPNLQVQSTRQQKSNLYEPFKSPLLKNPPNKESQKPLYEHQPTNQIINPHQEQNCLQVQSQAQNYPNLQVQSTRQVLNPISHNIILQIPPTDKPLTITLNLKFEM